MAPQRVETPAAQQPGPKCGWGCRRTLQGGNRGGVSVQCIQCKHHRCRHHMTAAGHLHTLCSPCAARMGCLRPGRDTQVWCSSGTSPGLSGAAAGRRRRADQGAPALCPATAAAAAVLAAVWSDRDAAPLASSETVKPSAAAAAAAVVAAAGDTGGLPGPAAVPLLALCCWPVLVWR